MKKSVAKGVVTAALLLLAACKVPVEYTALLIGDSLMANSLPSTTRQLLISDTVGFLPITNAIGSTTLCTDTAGAQYWRERGPAIFDKHRVDGVVISLGINDASQPFTAGGIEACASRLLRIYADAAHPVFWVLPHARGGVSDEQINVIAGAIKRAAANYPNARVLDFEAYARSQGYAVSTLLVPDGVHLTDKGNDVWGKMIRETLEADAQARGLAR